VEDRLDEIIELVKATKMGVRAKKQFLFDLDIAKGFATSGHTFAAQQASEEISSFVESMLSLARDRAEIADSPELSVLVGTPNTKALLPGKED